jgi:hypothetical protein
VVSNGEKIRVVKKFEEGQKSSPPLAAGPNDGWKWQSLDGIFAHLSTDLHKSLERI